MLLTMGSAASISFELVFVTYNVDPFVRPVGLRLYRCCPVIFGIEAPLRLFENVRYRQSYSGDDERRRGNERAAFSSNGIVAIICDETS